MSELGLILLGLSGLAFLEFFYLAVRFLRDREDGVSRRRLRDVAARLRGPTPRGADLSILKMGGEDNTPDSGWMIFRFARRFAGPLNLLLYRAGSKMGAFRFVALSASTAAVAAVVCLEIWFHWGVAIVLGVTAAALPFGVLHVRAKRMRKNFEKDFPEALALIARSLRGGHALQRSLHIVAAEMEDPVAAEFATVGDELSLGRDLGPVLQGLGHRLGLPDVELFSIGVMIQRDSGGNLAEIVEKLAEMIRERFKFRARVRAMTSMNRSSALLLAVVPVVFVGLMVVANPDFVRPLWTTYEGRTLAWVSGACTVLGYVLARWAGKVEA